MRIAVLPDIHGNRTAFEAVLADLQQSSPDLILHGGDLADGRCKTRGYCRSHSDLGWHGVVGTSDNAFPARVAGGVCEPIVGAS